MSSSPTMPMRHRRRVGLFNGPCLGTHPRVAVSAGAILLALLACSHAVLASDVPATASASFHEPAVLENLSAQSATVEVSLTARVARKSFTPGVETEVWTFNGSTPGPTLEVTEGDRVIVRFRNELPEATTIHWHGFHLPFDADGSPFHPVGPGEEYVYDFTVREGVAGTYWYHPHPHHRTGWHVGMGLFGAVVVRAKDDPLPASISERLLILHDTRLAPNGAIDLPERHSPAGRIDFENGREGDILLVNGQVQPTISIRSGETQRWRVLNVAGGRYYRLALDGHSFLHVGNDGGLFGHPVEVEEILLASAERVELLVQGTGSPGTRSLLRALPYDRYVPQTRPANWDQTLDLLDVAYGDEAPVTPVAIPATLRVVPALDPAEATATRLVVMTQGFLNNLPMDMRRVDMRAALGTTEIWELENIVGMDHPFHLHGFQFQVLDRNGVAEPFPSWKDVINVPRHQTARFIVRYDGYPGKWMFHCHILAHEDNGMMGIIEIY